MSFSVTVRTLRLAQTAITFVTLVTSSRHVKVDSSRSSPTHPQRLPSLTFHGTAWMTVSCASEDARTDVEILRSSAGVETIWGRRRSS